MEYTVQRGETIAQVTKAMGSDWRTLKDLNPHAVGRSRANGNWFVREGATLTDQKPGFAASLQEAEQQQPIAAKPEAATVKTESKSTGATELTHTLKAGETVWELATKKYHVNPADILKLNNITDPRSLQIGRTLRIPNSHADTTAHADATANANANANAKTAAATEPAEKTEVVASWYGTYHQGRPMANGEPFNMYGPTIAHKDIPLGTRVLLENPETGEKATATVTDRGPYIKGRDVDLSYKLAQKLSLEKQGVGNLLLTVL